MKVNQYDTRTLKMHYLDMACDAPCRAEPYPMELDQSEWQPQCLTSTLRQSSFYRLGGEELPNIDAAGLCKFDCPSFVDCGMWYALMR